MATTKDLLAALEPFARVWRALAGRPHIHRWSASCWNKFDKPSERTCRCGARQHLLTFDELWSSKWWNSGLTHERLGVDTVPWHDGPHPLAEEMRLKGLTRNF